MRFVLDTDTCVFALRHQPAVRRRLDECSPDDIAVTAMTEAELFFGALRSRDPDSSRRDVDRFLAPLARLAFDSEAAECHAALRFELRSQPVGERDLVIASTALARGGVLVTHNTHEFSRVARLPLEDWTRSA